MSSKTQESKTDKSEKKIRTIRVYVMGKSYDVPEGFTIMKAIEHAGYRYIRGAGCRAGFCGACATVYRKRDDYKLYTALACQTTAEEGMYLVQLPFVPANKKFYDLNLIKPTGTVMTSQYPEIARCVSCNTCTKACPQDLEVMDIIQASLRGDIEKAAQLSFDCLQCGLCTIRCPAEIAHYHVAQLDRRLYGKYILPRSKHLAETVKEVESGKYEKEMKKLTTMKLEELKTLYKNRDIEAGD